jgi:hypothetical protein
MTPQAAADAAGISRQGLMKQIRQGNFRAGGIEFIGRRAGKKWDVMLAAGDRAPQAAMGSLGGRPPGVPQMDTSQLRLKEAQLKVEKLAGEVKRLNQTNRDIRRGIFRDWCDCYNQATTEGHSRFISKIRAKRWPQDITEAVDDMVADWLKEDGARLDELIQEYEESQEAKAAK